MHLWATGPDVWEAFQADKALHRTHLPLSVASLIRTWKQCSLKVGSTPGRQVQLLWAGHG